MFKSIYIALVLFNLPLLSFAQFENYKGINIQGMHDGAASGSLNLSFICIGYSNDTIWYENHPNILLSAENTYSLMLGLGNYISGSESFFENIDWRNVEKVQLIDAGVSGGVIIAEFNLNPVPYSFHSLKIQSIPVVYELVDVSSPATNNGYLLKYNGTDFYPAVDLLADTSSFAYFAGNSIYTDTASYAFSSHDFVDSSSFSYVIDSSNYSATTLSSPYSDSTFYADTTAIAYFSINNWGILGNSNISPTNHVGTSTAHDFQLGTNGSVRYKFGFGNIVGNSSSGLGFQMNSINGMLFQPSSNSVLSQLSSPFLYFNGDKRATTIGHTLTGLGVDTIQGDYSFSFGEHSYATGTFSTVFGKNSRTDSLGSNPDAISSFVFGRNSIGAGMCVAIGDSAVADFYRNVAIGKNVTSTSFSATTAIGYNVLSKGATSWAAGSNLLASGNFSTALGSYASTNDKSGSFIFGDKSATVNVLNTANNQFAARSSGGVIFYSSADLSAGVTVSAGGGSWSMISDRTKKRGIIQIDYLSFENKIFNLPIYSWTYKQSDVSHIGPMAQDFYKSFSVGESERYINMIDFDGASLAGIKMLNAKLNRIDQKEEINAFDKSLNQEKSEFEDLEKRINEMYEKINN